MNAPGWREQRLVFHDLVKVEWIDLGYSLISSMVQGKRKIARFLVSKVSRVSSLLSILWSLHVLGNLCCRQVSPVNLWNWCDTFMRISMSQKQQGTLPGLLLCKAPFGLKPNWQLDLVFIAMNDCKFQLDYVPIISSRRPTSYATLRRSLFPRDS